MDKINYFPESPGLYLAQRNADVVLFKLTGMLPQLVVTKALDLSKLIEGNSIAEAPKELLANMLLYANQWNFYPIKQINMDVFPRLAFKCNGNLDLTTDELLSMKTTYYRFVQSGISSSIILKALVYEYKITMAQAINLVNKFDRDVSTSHTR